MADVRDILEIRAEKHSAGVGSSSHNRHQQQKKVILELFIRFHEISLFESLFRPLDDRTKSISIPHSIDLNKLKKIRYESY